MKIIYLDTETSGLKPGQIGQLSYIIDDGTSLIGKNMFFTVDFVEEGAFKATGMNAESYRIASGGQVFGDRAKEINADFEGGILVCHNVKFDKGFLDVEFYRQGMKAGYTDTFCTMNYFTDIMKLPRKDRYGYTITGKGYKSPRLEELGNWLNIDIEKVRVWAQKVFSSAEEISYHDSRFDTALMTVCMRAYTEMQCGDLSKGWYNSFVKGAIQ